MASTGFSFFDIGACNCNCACCPCVLPRTNLHVSYLSGGVTNTAILSYRPLILGSFPCTWSACISSGTVSLDLFQIQFSGITTNYSSFTVSVFPNCAITTGGGLIYQCNTSGFSTGTAHLVSHTCSPLNVVIAITGGPQWTITL